MKRKTKMANEHFHVDVPISANDAKVIRDQIRFFAESNKNFSINVNDGEMSNPEFDAAIKNVLTFIIRALLNIQVDKTH